MLHFKIVLASHRSLKYNPLVRAFIAVVQAIEYVASSAKILLLVLHQIQLVS